MAKTKAEKITNIVEEIRQLENKRRQLIQEQKAQERKDRTKRLCRLHSKHTDAQGTNGEIGIFPIAV